jgi:hypothetical protein
VIAFALLGSRLRVSYRTPLSGCAYDNGTGGASGLYRWCERLGMPAQRLESPLREAPGALAAATGNVVITMGDGPWSPSEAEAVPADWRAVRDWLARGNALIIATEAPGSLPAALREDYVSGKLEEIGRVLPEATLPERFRVAESVESHPETTEASATGGGSLIVERDGPRWKPSRPGNPAPGAPAMAPGTGPRGDEAVPAGWQLAGDDRGGVLFRLPVGQGACYVLLDAFAWTNAGLDAGDNAGLLAGILGREVRGGAVAFDEYRHGHGRAESFLTYLLSLPGASAFLRLALAWALLYYYARNVRLGPAERLEEPERRTAREYIDAVAQLNERARAAPLAVAAVAGRLRQLARSSVQDDVAVASLLREADAFVKAGHRPAAPREAIRLVRDMVQLRKQRYGSRSIP